MVPSFKDHLFCLEEFFAVCDDLGFRAEAETGRFGVYRSRIAQLNSLMDDLRAGEDKMTIQAMLATDLRRYLVALAESQEIAGILPFLRSGPGGQLAPRVRALLRGPELPSDEDKASNQARNVQFELWLAAKLWRTGVPVELEEPDLRCKIGGVTILFACKRLFSVRKLNKRINEATQQLRESLARCPETTSWGVIAISLSRVLIKQEQSEAITDRQQGLERLAARIETLVERRARWSQSREAQCIMFQLTSMFTNSETNQVESGSLIELWGAGPICESLVGKLTSIANP